MDDYRRKQNVTIGVLAVQGGFSEHISHLKTIRKIFSENNVTTVSRFDLSITTVKTGAELDNIDGLIIPGGESTTMSVFLKQNNGELLDALRKFTQDKPTFGTCAGLIMLANKVEGQMTIAQTLIGGLDLEARRNYYGSQKQSFEAHLDVNTNFIQENSTPMIFIRAPGIVTYDTTKVQVLATYNELPVAVQQNNLLAMSFHPELTEDLTWHLYFLKMIMSHYQYT